MKKNSFILLFLFAAAFVFSACSYGNGSDNEMSDNDTANAEIQTNSWYDLNDNIEWVKTNAQKRLLLEDHHFDEVNDEILRQCNELIKEDFGDDADIQKIMTAGFDINDDGTTDYFTVSFPKRHPGNSLPPLYLFISENGGYKAVCTPMKTEKSVTIMKTMTNGCFDLLWDDFGNELSFDGVDSYVGETDQCMKTIFFPVETENDKTVIKIGIPYQIEPYTYITSEPYCLKACFLDKDFVTIQSPNTTCLKANRRLH